MSGVGGCRNCGHDPDWFYPNFNSAVSGSIKSGDANTSGNIVAGAIKAATNAKNSGDGGGASEGSSVTIAAGVSGSGASGFVEVPKTGGVLIGREFLVESFNVGEIIGSTSVLKAIIDTAI